MAKLSKQQIGKCGELLVQLELLKRGIESAPMTTDSGIDLVAFSARKKDALTIQVKTNERPKPGAGPGSLHSTGGYRWIHQLISSRLSTSRRQGSG